MSISFRSSSKYDDYRSVYNKACSSLYPEIILRPQDTRDVSVGVQVAKNFGKEVSEINLFTQLTLHESVATFRS